MITKLYVLFVESYEYSRILGIYDNLSNAQKAGLSETVSSLDWIGIRMYVLNKKYRSSKLDIKEWRLQGNKWVAYSV